MNYSRSISGYADIIGVRYPRPMTEVARLTARRRERTDDATKLARHLSASIHEIADYAGDIDRNSDLDRVETALSALYHQLSNAASQVQEHRNAITDAKQWSEPPEFDVIPEER